MGSSNGNASNVIAADQLKLILSEMVTALRNHGVNYALIGGIAVTMRGRSRFTRDIDFLLDMPQLRLPALLDELAQRGFEFDLAATIAAWHQGLLTMTWRGRVRVDWMRPVVPGYQRILDLATEVDINHQPIRVATAEGLILLKLTAWRSNDQEDIRALLAKHAGQLDLEWIRREFAQLSAPSDPAIVGFEEMVREHYQP